MVETVNLTHLLLFGGAATVCVLFGVGIGLWLRGLSRQTAWEDGYAARVREEES